MEHLVSRHEIVATGEGCKVICCRVRTTNTSRKRFSVWSECSEWNKNPHRGRERGRVSKSVSTPTPLIWVMMTRWGRGTSVEAEWESWVREMCCRVQSVGGSEVGCSFIEPKDHTASELWLYELLVEEWEAFVHYFTLKGDNFSAQMEMKLDLVSQMSLYF